jgi:hypothetical protein
MPVLVISKKPHRTAGFHENPEKRSQAGFWAVILLLQFGIWVSRPRQMDKRDLGFRTSTNRHFPLLDPVISRSFSSSEKSEGTTSSVTGSSLRQWCNGNQGHFVQSAHKRCTGLQIAPQKHIQKIIYGEISSGESRAVPGRIFQELPTQTDIVTLIYKMIKSCEASVDQISSLRPQD